MDSILGLLSVKEWKRAHNAEVAYDTTGAKETPPAVSNGADGLPQTWMAYRFARVEAHGADLLVRILQANDTNPTMGSGDIHVPAGSNEIFQLAYGATVWVAAATGTATGAVIWGR